MVCGKSSLGLTKIVEWRKNLCGPVWKCGGFIAVRCQNRSLNGLEATRQVLKAELSEKMATKLAENEYTAAEEINQHSLVDQLLVLRNWHLDDNELKILIMKSLGIELDEKFWFNFKKR